MSRASGKVGDEWGTWRRRTVGWPVSGRSLHGDVARSVGRVRSKAAASAPREEDAATSGGRKAVEIEVAGREPRQ